MLCRTTWLLLQRAVLKGPEIKDENALYSQSNSALLNHFSSFRVQGIVSCFM